MKKSFNQQRISSLANWSKSVKIPGMEQADYTDILRFVLVQQKADGSWIAGGSKWATVMTAVVLKGLAAMEFKSGDEWERETGEGGIDLAINFLSTQVEQKGYNPSAIGEDIWDACQAGLALQKFGKEAIATPLAEQINTDWDNLYSASLQTKSRNRWSGPAYLAAVVDIIAAYDPDPARGRYAEAYRRLVACGEDLVGSSGKPLTCFHAVIPASAMDLWTTALTLRTLTTLPSGYEGGVDRNKIERVSAWMLEELRGGGWKNNAVYAEMPMLLARSLHGLRAARPWLSSETRAKIDIAIDSGNREIVNWFRQTPYIGDLKAYSAVVEYLSDWTVPASAGLIFHASQCLADAALVRSEPQPIEGGVRIAWISDLHVADAGDPSPGYFSPMKRFMGKFMQMKGTPLSQHMQLRNLQTILDQIKRLRPNHILVSGDLTNYAEESQFKSVHGQLLSVQTKLLDTDSANSDKLDAKFWTVLPGNHDVTEAKAANCQTRYNLGMFFHWFGSTFNQSLPESQYDYIFPVTKQINSPNGRLKARLIGLDSTVPSPVWRVGVNARGRIDSMQMDRLSEVLTKRSHSEVTLVALHHHPIVVPELVSELEDYFLSLDEAQGRALVQICAANDVNAILHGHFHRFSSWSGRTPQKHRLAIVGSPAGTLVAPGTDEEFLELREAEQETQSSMERGLALYSHKFVDNVWTSSFADVFLPARA